MWPRGILGFLSGTEYCDCRQGEIWRDVLNFKLWSELHMTLLRGRKKNKLSSPGYTTRDKVLVTTAVKISLLQAMVMGSHACCVYLIM